MVHNQCALIRGFIVTKAANNMSTHQLGEKLDKKSMQSLTQSLGFDYNLHTDSVFTQTLRAGTITKLTDEKNPSA